jgi:hypothetical protein
MPQGYMPQQGYPYHPQAQMAQPYGYGPGTMGQSFRAVPSEKEETKPHSLKSAKREHHRISEATEEISFVQEVKTNPVPLVEVTDADEVISQVHSIKSKSGYL